MKKFEDYQDEIYTCSRCGLCQSVCPVFELTKKETTVSRGFFSTLMGVLRGHLSFNKKIRKNIDMCLTCNKCKEFCPSGIDAEKIIISAKIASFAQAPVWKKLATRALYSRLFLNFAGMVRLYRVFPVLDFTFLGRVLHQFLKPTTSYQKQWAKRQSALKVAIFAGCVNNHFNSSSLNALRMILEQNGMLYVRPDFSCCAMPSFNIGDIENFKINAQKNIDKVPDDVDFLLFDCATCKKAFKIYAEVLEGEYQEKAQKLFEKCKHINEFLFEQEIFPEVKDKKIVYHKPCHLDCSKEITSLLCHSGADFEVLPERCCGSAGLFFLENSSISNELASKRLKEIKCVEVDYLATDCPLCRLGLIKGAILKNLQIKVVNLVEIFTNKP